MTGRDGRAGTAVQCSVSPRSGAMSTVAYLSFLLLWGWPHCAGIGAGNVCSTNSCYSAAERIRRNMDISVNPCDDFYSFTCGGFLKTAVIPNDDDRISAFPTRDIINEHLKDHFPPKTDGGESSPFNHISYIYSLCMDEERINSRGLAPALRLVEKAGGWPVLGNWSEDSWNLMSNELRLRSETNNVGNFFLCSVDADIRDPHKRLIRIHEPQAWLYQGILKRGLEDESVKAYYDYMVDVAVMFGADRETALKEMKEVLIFETEMDKLPRLPEDGRYYNMSYNLFTLRRLQNEIPWMDWRKFLIMIVPYWGPLPLDYNDLIMVENPRFLKELGNLLEQYPKRAIANYMVWNSIRAMVFLLTEDIRNRELKLFTILYGIKEREPRWKECLSEINRADIFDMGIWSLFVKSVFNESAKRETSEIADAIKKEMISLLEDYDWMSRETRSQALKKLTKLKINTKDVDDASNVNTYYLKNYLNGGKYLETYLGSFRGWNLPDLVKLRHPVYPVKPDWRPNSQDKFNTFYSLLDNSITIPSGILNNSLFNLELPQYLNLGRIGFTIAHEILHAVDYQGSQVNADGFLLDWWHRMDKSLFDQNAQCIVNQLNSVIDPETHTKINGENTQAVSIADNAAMKLIYQALRKLPPEPLLPGFENYTREQMFLIDFGSVRCTKTRPESLKLQIESDRHPIPHVRVNGVMRNLLQFQEIFHCSPNDPMVSQESCSVW